MRDLAIRVATKYKVSFLDFEGLKESLSLLREQFENEEFIIPEYHEEFSEELSRVEKLVGKEDPKAFLEYEDLLEIFDEYTYSNNKILGRIR